MKFTKHVVLVIFSLLATLAITGCSAPDTGTTVYIVRHAEKVTTPDAGSNPDLTEAGHARARLLSDMLGDKGISYIHSSDYIRNLDTANPLANKLGVEVEIYDPSNLPEIAAKIEALGGTHFLVGHSNTIAETVVALKGDGGSKVSDDEYDRLYTVRISQEGTVETELERFGKKFAPSE